MLGVGSRLPSNPEYSRPGKTPSTPKAGREPARPRRPNSQLPSGLIGLGVGRAQHVGSWESPTVQPRVFSPRKDAVNSKSGPRTSAAPTTQLPTPKRIDRFGSWKGAACWELGVAYRPTPSILAPERRRQLQKRAANQRGPDDPTPNSQAD